MQLDEILQAGLRLGSSDIHLKAGLPPMLRINGDLLAMRNAERLSADEVTRLAFSIMHDHQMERLRQTNDLELVHSVSGLGRFRASVFQQRGTLGVVFRAIPLVIPTIEELGLPPVLKDIAIERRGLVLVTGTTGSGKSTTLAAMIDHINTTSTQHVITIEDPIEFLITDRRSVVNQREVGIDTQGFSAALRSALRQDPDVILLGEMRDRETIEIAMTAAETGHLVMSTLHTRDASETIGRILSAFPPDQHLSVQRQLASVLTAAVSQRLVNRADGQGRVAAVEVMRTTARIRQLIEEGDTRVLPEAIAEGHTNYGMQNFDQHLMALLKSGAISKDEAIRQATNPDDFSLRLSGVAGTSDGKWASFEEPKKGAAMPRPTTPQQPADQPAAPPAGDDDFQIERF